MRSGKRYQNAKRIVILNHKGGVGKTTLTVNIGWSLAKQNKKVLFVDTDPQVNLTSYLITEEDVKDLLDKSDSNKGETIWSSVKPLVDATADINIIEPKRIGNNLFILPGDIKLSTFEQELNTFWTELIQRKNRGYNGVTALSFLVNEIARKYKIDYVFFDAAPNIGPLNKTIFLDCDYFIIPAACDLFSLWAIKTLGQTIHNWLTEYKTISALSPDNIYMLSGKPKLLGYIPQRFRVWRGQPTSEYANFLPQIERSISTEIIKNLLSFDPSLVTHPISKLNLGEVKDFASLAPASQLQGVALEDTTNGDSIQKSLAKEIFEKITKKIIDYTSLIKA